MKIAEVSEHYGISSDTLRYYERIGLIPPVTRNVSGIRNYGELDIRRVEFVKCMRSAGLPIEVLIDYMELVQQGDQTIEARKEILKEQREQLVTRMAEMQKQFGMSGMGMSFPEEKTLVINDNNAIIKKLMSIQDDEDKKEKFGLICNQIADLALIGNKELKAEELDSFIKRSNEIMTLVLDL